MTYPQVSVIIPTKDRPHVLHQALESVALQTGVDVEVVIVNDGGADLSESVREIGRRLTVRVVDRPVPGGPSAARNTGLDAAEGTYTAFLDDDDLFLPGHLETAVKRLEAEDADLVYSTVLIAGTRSAPGAVPIVSDLFDLPFRADFLHVQNYIPTSAVVCRGLQEVARFDPGLRVVEDWDLWLRLVDEHGFVGTHDPSPGVVYHRVPDVDSLTTALEDLEAHRLFDVCYHRVIDRWAVPAGSPQDRARRWMPEVYEMVYDRLRDGRRLGPHWYERVVHAHYAAFSGQVDEDSLPALRVTALDVP